MRSALRKSQISLATTRRRTTISSLGKGLSQSALGEEEGSRTWARQAEVALAAVIWMSAFPLLLFVVPAGFLSISAVLLLAVLAALLFHSSSLHPFCIEKPPEVEVEGVDDEAVPNEAQALAVKDRWEELKLLLTCLVFLSAVGCLVSLARGGSAAFHAQMASGTGRCSVAELQGLHKAGHAKFFCQDGFINLTKQASLLTRGDGFRGAMKTYRMAPVYAGHGLNSTVPVAWGVAKDNHFSASPCGSGSGLCGLLVPTHPGKDCMNSLVCFSSEERRCFAKLREVISEDLRSTGAAEFDADGLPLVIPTDPGNPQDNNKHLFRALGMWAFTLVGLLLALLDILANECWHVNLPWGYAKLGRTVRVDGSRPGNVQRDQPSRDSAASATSLVRFASAQGAKA